jgi:hypothetical protein
VGFIALIGGETASNHEVIGVGCVALVRRRLMRTPPPDSAGGWGRHCSARSHMSAMEDVGPSGQHAKAKGKSALRLRPLLGRPKMMRARACGWRQE